jgi:hypothetical protein
MAKPPGGAVKMFRTSYSTVKAALVATYRIPRKAHAAFHGRLGHLQRQGLFGARHMPGRGNAIAYGPDQFWRLIFACECFEFGLSRATVLALVNSLWERRLCKVFRVAESAAMTEPGANGENTGGDIILHMGGVRLMTDAWSDAVPNVNSCELRKLPDSVAMWMRMTPRDPTGLPPRALVVNLSMRLRTFHEALVAAHNLSEPVPAMTAEEERRLKAVLQKK